MCWSASMMKGFVALESLTGASIWTPLQGLVGASRWRAAGSPLRRIGLGARRDRNWDAEVFGGVAGGDALAFGGRKVVEGAIEERAGARPVGSLERVKRLPEQVFQADLLAVLEGAGIDVEGCFRVALEVLAGQHLEVEAGVEAVVPVHPVDLLEEVGQPAGAGAGEAELQRRELVQDAAQDDAADRQLRAESRGAAVDDHLDR